LDTIDGQFHIRGVSVKDKTDTFTQGFILSKKEIGFFNSPTDADYRMMLTHDIPYVRNKIYHRDTIYVMLSKRQGERFDKGKIYYFKFNTRHKNILDIFMHEKAQSPFYTYYFNRL
jgi:hypothetical protein